MSWIEINFNEIPQELLDGNNIIYGAGGNGKRVYYKLKEYKIPVKGFYDDDSSRWGEEVCDGKCIYSRAELDDMNKDRIHCILASVFINEMEKKADAMGVKLLYGVNDLILSYNEETFQIFQYKNDQNYIKRQNEIRKHFKDEESLRYFDMMYDTIIEGKALNSIMKIICREEIYFLDRFIQMLKDMTFVDCGAFKGDTLSRFITLEPDYNSVYCFEADKTNFDALQMFVNKIGKKNLICENYALWNTETVIGMEGSGVCAKVSEKGTTMIPAITLDRYFADIKVDYIKMDIEGAELNALKGGMKVIKRDRPILAVCIYHTMMDRIEVPELLINSLENYEFLIRHHGYSYCDSVMYCIPIEKGNANKG